MLTGFASGLLAQHIVGTITGNAILCPIEENISASATNIKKSDIVITAVKATSLRKNGPVEETADIAETKSPDSRTYVSTNTGYITSDNKLSDGMPPAENDIGTKKAHEPSHPEEESNAVINNNSFSNYGSNGITSTVKSSKNPPMLTQYTQGSGTLSIPTNPESVRTADENIPIPELALCDRDYEIGPDIGGTRDILLPDLPSLE